MCNLEIQKNEHQSRKAFADLEDVENLSPEEMQRKIEELESAIASAEKEQGSVGLESPSALAELDPVRIILGGGNGGFIHSRTSKKFDKNWQVWMKKF